MRDRRALRDWTCVVHGASPAVPGTFEALMSLDGPSRRSFRAFHRVVMAMASTTLWRNDELHVNLALSGGDGILVHRKDFPDFERFRSLMLDFRQLLNNDDSSNLNRTHNLVHQNRASHGWTTQELYRVSDARRRFSEALDQDADFYTVVSGEGPPSVRDLLADWISGEWFHGDEDRRARRLAFEFSREDDLSLSVVIPAVRVAIAAAIDLDAVIAGRFADDL